MTMGLWLDDDLLSDVDKLINYFNLETFSDGKRKPLYEILSVEFGLTMLNPQEINPFILSVLPRERKCISSGRRFNPRQISTGDHAQGYFADFNTLMQYACKLHDAFESAGIEVSWNCLTWNMSATKEKEE